MRFTKRYFRNTNLPIGWKFLTAVSALVLALVFMPAPTHAASDNTNLIQQILAAVQSLQTILGGTDVSVSALQSAVTAIKTKTDSLPTDTEATLTDIKNSVGSGALTQMYMKSFTLYIGEKAHVQCSSSRPFLLHIHGSGGDGLISVESDANLAESYAEYVTSNQNAHIVFGGNPADSVKIYTANFSGIDYIRVLITMQTTEDAYGSCSPY